MNIPLLFNTLKYLLPVQIQYQIFNRFYKCHLEKNKYTYNGKRLKFINCCSKYNCLFDNCYFRFLNIKAGYTDWNDNRFGNLWTYNLNYMDWLLQPDITIEEGGKWIDKFIAEIDENRIGLDPYPTALRGINWIKFISAHYNEIRKERLQRWNESLYNQYCLLERKLEFHLLGNHLIEDLMSLFIASLYFQDKKFYIKSRKNLRFQLKEQILNDGAHYEQSAMYHCILLDRLLDCYNFSKNNLVFVHQEEFTVELEVILKKMLGHLENIIYSDGAIPLINDAAYGIAPTPEEIFKYAKRLNLTWEPIPLSDCGFRRFNNDRFEGIIDISDIKASYQPGHSHADTFTYELKIDGMPFIVDTGISTYEKNHRRQYERSTKAHNSVVIDDKDSSEVWGGFRIGKRASITLLKDSEEEIIVEHNGYGKRKSHKRIFKIIDDQFVVEDYLPRGISGKNLIHLAPDIDIISYDKGKIVTSMAVINICGADEIIIIDDWVSLEYNVLIPTKVLNMAFKGEMKYSITLTK